MIAPVLSLIRRAGYRIEPAGLIAALVVLFWVAAALAGPWLTASPDEIVDIDFYSPMSRQLWFGSDYLGRDMLARIVMGARYTVGIGFASSCLASLVGATIGMSAAAIGGWIDAVVSRLIDAFNAIPSKLFGLVLVAAVGSSIPTLIVLMAVIYMPGAYRFSRSLAVNVQAMDFVIAARARGERIPYLVIYEILPNIVGPVLTDLGLRFVFIVLLLSGLSFLGLGVQPPNADWGSLVHENIGGLSFAAPAVIFPCLAIASLTIAVNTLIDNLPTKIRDRSP